MDRLRVGSFLEIMMEEEPRSSTFLSWRSFLRENRWGRTAFLLALLIMSRWLDRAVFALRDAMVGAGDTASESLRDSFNVDGLARMGGRVASSISREWWEVLTALLIIGMGVAAVRFLDGVRPRFALAELGLRGGLPRAWRRMALVPLLPPLCWLGYVMFTTEPRLLTEPWTWKSYFLPYADLEGSVFARFFEGNSARPVWWLSAGVGAFATALFTYGLVWQQLRRLGFCFAAVVALMMVGELSSVVVDIVRFPGSASLLDFPEGTVMYLLGLCFTVSFIALSGWIVERWGGRFWVPALVLLSVQLPHLLAFPFYSVDFFQNSDGHPWLIWTALLVCQLVPLILLAVLTAMAPRLGLPSLSRRNE